jgi:transcriptional regulator with XRE-family HTH domain
VDRASAFADALRRHRHAAGLTQEELAERAHLSGRAISDLERGLKAPLRATVRMLIEALMLPPEQADVFDATARLLALTKRTEAGAPGKTAPRAEQTCVAVAHREAARRPTNLPSQRQRLIGRERDADGLRQILLDGHASTVTLVGPGGVGKTRLGLEVASQLLGEHADGVWLVDLSAVSEVELLVPTVATALGVRVELDCEPTVTLLAYLANRWLLLMLDNCEHLVEGCADLVRELRQRCSGVRVLATSREPLGCDGEVVWRLKPLEAEAAVQLFVERARAQDPTISFPDDAAVGQLCRRLDGLPLAIELATARVSMLSPAEMLGHLEDRFALLRRTRRGTSARQQTLRATFDWSYELLDSAEQQLFRLLAVFTGSFDLLAAAAMGGPDTVDRLGHLIDKSLVIAESSPAERATALWRACVSTRGSGCCWQANSSWPARGTSRTSLSVRRHSMCPPRVLRARSAHSTMTSTTCVVHSNGAK